MMSRPLRIEFEGAWYHVMNRGTGRKTIFFTDEQRNYFLSLLGDVSFRFGAEIHAYCLMSNHYHLMIRTPEGNLQRIMRHINGVYTQYFNRTQKKDGALFRGRYKAIVVDADAYWIHLSRYIHLNPLDAKLVKQISQYRWSSYPAFIGKVKGPDWLIQTDILGGRGTKNQRARYKAFVEAGVDNELKKFYSKKGLSLILGDKDFQSRVLAGMEESIDVPDIRKHQSRKSITEIVAVVASYYQVPPNTLYEVVRGRNVSHPGRAMAMFLAQEQGGHTLSAIASAFKLKSYASASSSIRNLRQRLVGSKKLRKDLKQLLLALA
ncbi:transposase [Zooshikella ganghwensis]|uniref:transposase n=1 Tax=Zooshikella ganghwensis TaxID=202772 RepID=UPI001B7FA956|nr:transposase [Zooshikella ganghwensis]